MIMLNMNGLTRSNFMNKYEEYFIKKFIYQNKRDRFIYEFTKKREEAIDRFSHDINKYIIDKRIEKVIYVKKNNYICTRFFKHIKILVLCI